MVKAFKFVPVWFNFVRSVGKTEMNEHSSRSHFVFTLTITGVNEVGYSTGLFLVQCSVSQLIRLFLMCLLDHGSASRRGLEFS